uniref:SFRICE_035065 n=1 Tax=Spodoptera frugiperda TaxID=7108 RepID=A0A2H1VCE0_SPOFR
MRSWQVPKLPISSSAGIESALRCAAAGCAATAPTVEKFLLGVTVSICLRMRRRPSKPESDALGQRSGECKYNGGWILPGSYLSFIS